MTIRFADTYYLVALVNTRDKGHEIALQYSQGPSVGLLTTTWVLVEFADALSSMTSRARAARFIRGIQQAADVEVVPPSREQFDRALALYEQRPDKDWSLTDCLSFLVMDERGIVEALTADHHFEQAGFLALLRNDQAR
jgi:predicted nucleic acid-binding protein